jgi:hypothetical protein
MTAVSSGDRLGNVSFNGSDGTSFQASAFIGAYVDGTVSDVNDSVPGRLVFSTTADGASSPTERMRITSAGMVGIGTSTSTGSVTLQIQRSSSIPANGSNSGGICVRSGASTTTDVEIVTGTQADSGGEGYAYLSVNRPQDVNYSPGYFPKHFRFAFGNSEVYRIDSSKRILIGTSSSQGSYNLQCFGTGVWGQGAYVNGSDESIKQNINDISSSLEVVKNLRPVTFEYKPEYSQDQTVQAGFVAQELQTAMAGQNYLEGIVQQGTNHLNVAYQSIIPVLTKALQEAIAKIETLEAKVAALEGA